MRLAIVRELAAAEPEPRACGTFRLGVSNSTLTHHFKVLREAGVIETQPQGHLRLNRLRREELDARFPGLLDSVLRPVVRA